MYGTHLPYMNGTVDSPAAAIIRLKPVCVYVSVCVGGGVYVSVSVFYLGLSLCVHLSVCVKRNRSHTQGQG